MRTNGVNEMNGQEKSAYQYLLTLVRLQREEPDKPVSLEAVSNEFGVNRSTVSRALRRYREDGTLDERYRLTPQGEGWLNSENQQVYRLEGFLKE
ncbi:MAG: helix-turn-helix domain-containing protein, partial [Eubacteriales bacterium]|nr:helix-turn-helix domain-containing protein [Eubacteriales bacterium]